MRRIFGNQALVVTPMLDDGEIDEPGLRRMIDYVVEGGVDGILLLGSTGEFFSLDQQEQARVMAVASEQVAGRTALAFGAANTGSRLAARTAVEAERAGADYILVPPPYYSPLAFTSERGTYAFFREIADATSLQVMLYDGGSGIEIPFDVLRRLASETPNVRLVKVNVAKPAKVAAIREAGMTAFCGIDPLTMPMMRYGAQGFTLGVGNILPAETSALYASIEAGDWGKAENIFYPTLLPMINSTLGFLPEFIAAFKLVLFWKGIISSPAVRRPLMPLDETRQRELRSVAARCGLISPEMAG